MNYLRFLSLGLLWSIAMASSAAPAAPLTLEQAIARATTADPRIRERQHLVEAARGLLQEVEGHRDWRFDINLYAGFVPAASGNPFEAGSCAAGNCVFRDDRRDINGLSLLTSLTFSVIKPLMTFGKVENYRTAADANIRVKQEDVKLQRAQTRLDVQRAYWGYLAARDGRVFLHDVEGRLQRAVDTAQRLLDQGEGTVRLSDVHALQTGLALIGKYKAQAQGLEQVALAALHLLVNAPPEPPLELAEETITPVEQPTAALADLQATALQQRPEQHQVEAGLRARQALVAARTAERLPNVYAGVAGLFNYAPNRESLDSPYIYDPANERGVSPIVGLQWHWERGVQPARVAQAQAELNALVEKADLARHGIPFQVAEQYYAAQAGWKAVQKVSEGSRSARRWMVSTYADFEAGLQGADKVVAAFQGYILAQTEYFRSVFDYNMSVAQLHNALGKE